LAPDQPPPTFAAFIKEMIIFAGTAANWQHGRYSADLKLAVAGLSRWQSGPIHERHIALVEVLQPEWGEWVRPMPRKFMVSTSHRLLLRRAWRRPNPRTGPSRGWPNESATQLQLTRTSTDMLLKLFGRHSNLFRGDGQAAADARLYGLFGVLGG
jgi:hypothetical protein